MLDQKTQELLIDLHALLPLIVTTALNAVGALVILLIGIWLSGKAHLLVVRALDRAPHVDPMLRSFFGSITRYAVLTVTVLAVLSQFGIQTASLVTVIGAAGLAIGLALQGTLSNLAAGVMLLIFRPFKIGHKVQIGGMNGTVKELSLFWTELVTDDQIQIIVPNSGVWGQPLRNFSYYTAPPHTAEARFRVPDTIDLDATLDKIRAIVSAHPRILKTPAPTILLDRTAADNALEVVVGFSMAEDIGPAVKTDIIKSVHDALHKSAPPAPASAPGPAPG